MSPSVGRFIAMDEYQGSILDPVSLHKYLYANANPMMYTGPTGYYSLGEVTGTLTVHSIITSMVVGGGSLATLNSFIRFLSGEETTPGDAGIPKSQQPEAVTRVNMCLAQHKGGHVIEDSKGNVIITRKYVYINKDGKKVIIHDHSAGLEKGGQGPHLNVRPADNTRTGKVPGTQEH